MGFASSARAMKGRLVDVESGMTVAAFQALNVETEDVITDSKKNYVPVDTGALRSSGHAIHAVKDGNRLVAKVNFGGSGAPYALAVHENHATKSDYLKRPLLAHMQGMDGRIANFIKRETGM